MIFWWISIGAEVGYCKSTRFCSIRRSEASCARITSFLQPQVAAGEPEVQRREARALNECVVEIVRERHFPQPREAAVLDRLRDVPFVPALLDVVDNGDWIALLIEGVHGRLPTARDSSAVTRVLSLLTRVQSLPPGLLPPMGDPSFAQLQISPWADLAADGAALDPWSVEHLDELLTLEQQAGALEGTVVCHGDFRLDNVLFTADGHTSLADWAHAKAGPDFADLVEVCIDIHVEGGPAPAVTFAAHAPTALHTSDGVTAYLAAVTGRLTRQGTFAEPPGMTDFRAFQQRQAASAQSWLARRMAAGI